MYNMFEIIPLLFYLFKGYCLQYFWGSFLEERSKSKWTAKLAAAVLYAAFLAVIGFIEPAGALNSRPAIWKLSLSFCMLFVIACCFYKGFRLITIFLLASFQAVADISQYTIAVLYGKLSGGLYELLKGSFIDIRMESYQTSMLIMNGVLIGELVLGYAAMGLLLFFSLKRIVKDFREKAHGINVTELLFLIVPSAVGLTICMLLRIIMVNVENGVQNLIYQKYPALTAIIPAILLLSLFSILCGVKLFQDMIHLNAEKSSRIILEKQIEGLQTHIEEMERIYSDLRGMKHDLKNTVSVIKRLSDNSANTSELQKYISEVDGRLEKLDIRFNTGNTVADTLLNMKYYEAVRNVPNINIYADDLIFSQELKIQSYDIGIILGNALDNAVEACKRLKANEPSADTFIRLRSVQKGNFLILKVENSFCGKLAVSDRNGFPETDKADKMSHGIGLANIKNTAEKYQGTMDFRANDRVFTLSVMMKNETC